MQNQPSVKAKKGFSRTDIVRLISTTMAAFATSVGTGNLLLGVAVWWGLLALTLDRYDYGPE